MINTIKSEFRRLITVRSTLVVSLIAAGFIALVSFYVEGYWGQSGSAAGQATSQAISEIFKNSAGMAALFISVIVILQVGHEYRYNTILYTLTANARRTQVFLSKLLVLGLFAVLMGFIMAWFGVLAYRLGLSFRDVSLPAQDFSFGVEMFRLAVYSFAYSMVGFLLAVLLKSVISAIVILLIFPTTVEPLLGVLLKDNSVYLPFSTFDHILGVAARQTDFDPNKAMVVSFVYIGVLGLITWLLFVRRDAN